MIQRRPDLMASSSPDFRAALTVCRGKPQALAKPPSVYANCSVLFILRASINKQ
jgi:hypothetical protein